MPVIPTLRAAEFFAGIGLVGLGLQSAGVDVVWANDIEASKRAMYVAHFGRDAGTTYTLGDVRDVSGTSVPTVDLATASFPCTDLSLAGNRQGLAGRQSGMFWEFARVLEEMESRAPAAILLENVPGFATSNAGDDIRAAIRRLNALGYVCDLLAIDAIRFVPQSRLRLFIVGTRERFGPHVRPAADDPVRPEWLANIYEDDGLELQALSMPAIHEARADLRDVVEDIPLKSDQWWAGERLSSFLDSLSDVNSTRVDLLRQSGRVHWRTAYRRTRNGVCRWEIRGDEVAGCLRTARGGSSKQALVRIGPRATNARWMTPREYAALQGAPHFTLDGSVSSNKALFGFGDAVCVPAIEWLAHSYLGPALLAMRDGHAELHVA